MARDGAAREHAERLRVWHQLEQAGHRRYQRALLYDPLELAEVEGPLEGELGRRREEQVEPRRQREARLLARPAVLERGHRAAPAAAAAAAAAVRVAIGQLAVQIVHHVAQLREGHRAEVGRVRQPEDLQQPLELLLVAHAVAAVAQRRLERAEARVPARVARLVVEAELELLAAVVDDGPVVHAQREQLRVALDAVDLVQQDVVRPAPSQRAQVGRHLHEPLLAHQLWRARAEAALEPAAPRRQPGRRRRRRPVHRLRDSRGGGGVGGGVSRHDEHTQLRAADHPLDLVARVADDVALHVARHLPPRVGVLQLDLVDVPHAHRDTAQHRKRHDARDDRELRREVDGQLPHVLPSVLVCVHR